MVPEFAFRFVNFGTRAPAEVASDELWLDVGGDLRAQVLDHHYGDSRLGSASNAVLMHMDNLVRRPLKDQPRVTIVVHDRPDLDCVCSAWLAGKSWNGAGVAPQAHHYDQIVNMVAENDMGLVRAQDPLRCWPIVMRQLIDDEADDQSRMTTGMKALDATLRVLQAGGQLEEAAEAILTIPIRSKLAYAQRDYMEDLARAVQFTVRLPVRPLDPAAECNQVAGLPDVPGGRWCLADALFVEEPSSALFKELARGDRENSSRRQGFSALIIATSAAAEPTPELVRFRISTDPLTGLYLQGLGPALERREQAKEDTQAVSLGRTIPRRIRVDVGKGRDGYNVTNPWYDGRGHAFTILDSPARTLGDIQACGSILSAEEVLEVVWAYGDPSRFVRHHESVFTLFCAVQRVDGWQHSWAHAVPFAERCSDLQPEVIESLSGMRIVRTTSIAIMAAPTGTEPISQELWYWPDGPALWIAQFRASKPLINLRDANDSFHALVDHRISEIIPGGLVPSSTCADFILAHCRVGAADMSLHNQSGASEEMTYRLAGGEASQFRNRAAAAELDSASRVLSRDRANLMVAFRKGAAVISNRNRPFELEEDFHRPEHFAALVALALLQKIAVKQLTAEFLQHRSGDRFMEVADKILNDRRKLMNLDHAFLFSTATNRHFGQAAYAVLKEQFQVSTLMAEARAKIDALASEVREARATFFERTAFWVSIVFAPLAVVSGLFGGIQMDKRFSEERYSPFHGDYAGWVFFAAVFALCSLTISLLWFLLSRANRRKQAWE